jgi:hypothetical protein
MNRLSKTLTLALVIQLLLLVAVFWPASNEGQGTAKSALLDLDATVVDRIAISDSQSGVVLSRTGDNWQLPEYHSLPVDPAKLSQVLNTLPSLSRGWPVTTSRGAQARFQVAEDEFQRRVEYFAQQQTVAGLFTGTSPGFRKVHVRAADTDPVYAVEFNSFELPTEPDQWLDKTLLQVSDVQAIAGLDFNLSRQDGSWLDENGNAALPEAVDGLVNGLTSLRVTAAADIAIASVLGEMAVPPTLTVESSEGTIEFRLYEMAELRYIQRADIAVYFSLSDFDYSRLVDVDQASLYPTPGQEPPEG